MDPTQPTQPLGTQTVGEPRHPEHGRYDGGQGQSAGFGDRAEGAVAAVARHVKTPETKEFFKTSEFLVWGLVTAFLLIAAAVVTGDDDHFVAEEAWRYVTIVSAAYILSRGISKSGTRRGYGDAPFDR